MHLGRAQIPGEAFRENLIAKSMAVVQVKTKAVTGRIRYYPVGPSAAHVIQLTKKKTLSELDLEALKALGCSIDRVAGEPDEAR